MLKRSLLAICQLSRTRNSKNHKSTKKGQKNADLLDFHSFLDKKHLFLAIYWF